MEDKIYEQTLLSLLKGDNMQVIKYLSEFYPFSEPLISKCEKGINWDSLSLNRKIPWNENLIQKYKQKWDWNLLSCNSSLPLSLELVDNFKDFWNWRNLSMQDLP